MSNSGTKQQDPHSDAKKFGRRYKLDKFKDQVIKELEKFPNGLNINQISDNLKINRNTTSKYLKTLEATNDVISRKIGVATLWYKAEKNKQKLPGPNIITTRKIELERIEIENTNEIYASSISKQRESLIGKNLWDFYPFNDYENDLKTFFEECLHSGSSTNKTHFSQTITLSKKTEDQDKELILKIELILPQGIQGEQLTISYYDLSFQKELEKELLNSSSFTTILNMVPDYLSICTRDHKVILANRPVLETFNENQELPVEDVYCFDLFHDRDKECSDCPVNEAFSKGPQVKIRDLKLVGACNYECYPITTKSGLEGYILKIQEK